MRGSANEMATVSSLDVAMAPGRVRPDGVEPGVLNTDRSRIAVGFLVLLALVALAVGLYSKVDTRSLGAEVTALAPLSITYDRSAVAEGIFSSVATGDLAGRWVATLVTGSNSPIVFSGEFYWTFIGDDPNQSFVAHLKGKHSHLTDEIIFDGTIVAGYMLGARVEDRGWLSGHSNSTMSITVKGTIQIFPAAAGVGG